MPLLELKNISSAYGSVEALRGVSLHVDKGEVVTLLGANGAGKSTTLRTISGLITPTSGEIWFEGQRIDTLAPEQIVRMGISHVPEGRRIFPGLTVKENIMLGSTARGHLSKQAMADGVEEMFGIFPDIKRFADSLGWTLSGGQQQMLAVARGLMAKPKLLLLDEPSSGSGPGDRAAALRDHPRDPRPRHHHPAGGAKRPHGTVRRGPRLCARDRQHDRRRHDIPADGQRGSAGGLSGRARGLTPSATCPAAGIACAAPLR